MNKLGLIQAARIYAKILSFPTNFAHFQALVCLLRSKHIFLLSDISHAGCGYPGGLLLVIYILFDYSKKFPQIFYRVHICESTLTLQYLSGVRHICK